MQDRQVGASRLSWGLTLEPVACCPRNPLQHRHTRPPDPGMGTGLGAGLEHRDGGEMLTF